MVNKFLGAFISSLLANNCILCDRISSRPIDLCQACQDDLPRLKAPLCQLCQLPLAATGAKLCARCLKTTPSFNKLVAGWRYELPVDELISQFKYQRQLAHGKVLSLLLAKELRRQYHGQPLPDMLTPTPLHWRSLWSRGYNQSDFIAQHLSKALKLPIQRNLHRRRHTPKQQGLSAKQREVNLKDAFQTRDPQQIKAKVIALVDDVVTTGATADAMSSCLIKAGAREVHLWCLARTPLSD